MNRLSVIVKIKDKYSIWSIDKKRPCYYLMDKDELINFIEEVEGEDYLDSIDIRLKRLEEKGISVKSLSKEDIINNNKAGQNKEYINEDKIYIEYSIGYNNKYFQIDKNNENNNILINNKNIDYNINNDWYISDKYLFIMFLISLILAIVFYFADIYSLDNRVKLGSVAIIFYFIGILSSSKMKIWRRKIK